MFLRNTVDYHSMSEDLLYPHQKERLRITGNTSILLCAILQGASYDESLIYQSCLSHIEDLAVSVHCVETFVLPVKSEQVNNLGAVR